MFGSSVPVHRRLVKSLTISGNKSNNVSSEINTPIFERPDGIGTVTVEEKDMFIVIKDKLRTLLEYQITNFR